MAVCKKRRESYFQVCFLLLFAWFFFFLLSLFLRYINTVKDLTLIEHGYVVQLSLLLAIFHGWFLTMPFSCRSRSGTKAVGYTFSLQLTVHAATWSGALQPATVQEHYQTLVFSSCRKDEKGTYQPEILGQSCGAASWVCRKNSLLGLQCSFLYPNLFKL